MTISIGVILRKARERRRLTQDEVSKYIKIPLKYIRYMESDDYLEFSDKVHAKGFLKVYSGFLGLNIDEILALWRREYETIFDKKKPEKVTTVKKIETRQILITPMLILAVFTGLCILVFFSYLYFQYKNYTGAPVLTVYNPKDNVVVSRDILDVTGKTDLDSEIFINNQKLVLNPDGSFAESVKLKEGLNTISIKAVNKLDKSTEYIKTVIFRKDPAIPVIQESTQSTGSSGTAPSVIVPNGKN